MEEKDDDENVWNAVAVILDIDSGVFNEKQPQQISKLMLICHVIGVRMCSMWRIKSFSGSINCIIICRSLH